MIPNMSLDTVQTWEELATEKADMLDPAGGVQGHVSFLQLCLHWPVRDVNVQLDEKKNISSNALLKSNNMYNTCN